MWGPGELTLGERPREVLVQKSLYACNPFIGERIEECLNVLDIGHLPEPPGFPRVRIELFAVVGLVGQRVLQVRDDEAARARSGR